MKKIYVKDTWRRMKRTIVTVMAIILIICLGISSYLGIAFARISMEKTGNQNFSKQKFHHFEINYQYGITEDDMEKITGIVGIDDVEGLYKTTGFLAIGEGNRLVTVQSVTSDVDVARVIEGRLPEKKNEIAIERVMADEDGIGIGEELKINCKDKDGKTILLEEKFKVVGIVQHPTYSCNYVYSRRGLSEKGNGNCLNYFLVSKDAFDQEELDGCFQSALIWSDTLNKYNCFSTQYEEESNNIKQRIENIAGGQSSVRYADVKAVSVEEVDNEEKIWSNASEELSHFEKDITDGEENKAKLDDAKQAVADLVETNWNVYDREANVSYAMYKDNAEGLGKLSFSFAFVYIVVAFMVCYSSIGRMITKQKMLIGTQKALGFHTSEILVQYLSYAWVCTFWGCVWGVLWAIFFVEKISLTSYKPIYYFEEYVSAYDLKLTIIVIVSAFVLTSGATVIACRKQIRKSTVLLLKDEVIGEGKEFFFEKWRLWKKISLFKRTIVKNLLNEKRHMITTIIGIAGCTALMIIGFTMKFAISDVKIEQFEHIQKFDVSLQVEAKENGKEYLDILEQFDKIKYISLLDQMIGVRLNNKDYIVADLLCAEADELNEFFLLEDKKTKEQVKDYGDGVLISANTADFYNVKVSDTIDIMKRNGEEVSVKVSGIVKNYVCHFLAMSPEYYEKVMGEDVDNNIYFIKLNGTDQSDLEEGVRTQNGFLNLAGKEMGISIFENIADSLNSVIQVMICLSAIMALIVVLNLLVMYVNEKSKILAIMRINGFSVREVKSFINFSNVILIIVGLGVGAIIGVLLGIQIVIIIENDSVTYSHEPNLTASLLSCGISIVYAFIISKIANRKINNLPLTNLNRFE